MNLHRFLPLLLLGLLLANCASDTENSNKENGYSENNDRIAFIQLGSENAFQMNLSDQNVLPLVDRYGYPRKWENQQQVLNVICSGGSPKITSTENGVHLYETPISVFSPDGAPLGLLDDNWEPAWSPDGQQIAIACGPDENGDVVVVSNSEHTGSSEGWSRSGSGTLSDRMEIFVTNPEGNAVRQMTNNESGDWLPKWFPSTRFDPGELEQEETIGYLPNGDYVGFSSPIIFETNRDGKSEILVKATLKVDEWHLSRDYPKAQSPAWSENGNAAVFTGGELDEFNIIIVSELSDSELPEKRVRETSQEGIPISWGD
mgnify:CR=1 FL=1